MKITHVSLLLSLVLLPRTATFTAAPCTTTVCQHNPSGVVVSSCCLSLRPRLLATKKSNNEESDEDEEGDPIPLDPYQEKASSEFRDAPDCDERNNDDSSIVFSSEDGTPVTTVDWGGALGKLRTRVDDVQSGKSQDPSVALFRLLSAESPNQAIGNFVTSANPQVVQAMSGAVSSLLGGLANPAAGIETVVKATGDKVATLCFQLQMTGYLFRNAEYVVALKQLMKLKGEATLQDYKDAFDRLDSNGSGYIESAEVEELFRDVYDGKIPGFEVNAFVGFFDENKDGRISWDEFKRGLLGMADNVQVARRNSLFLSGNDDEDDRADTVRVEPVVAGTLKIEMENGTTVSLDAEEYVTALKAEAKALKEALQRERGAKDNGFGQELPEAISSPQGQDEMGNIIEYIESRQGDVKALTEGISPEIVDTMKLLVDFVLDGGQSGKGQDIPKEQMQMELPSSALQQLALWQLVMGYRLREAEAKGDYLRLLE